ncbi:hypothetical protein QQS21_011517 [Conoideocrella luteorostrata]|uniref:Up-regulated in Daf-2 domain-containing protein n=1 Tax=Conoideocrella luteorostrata TaxID=1105319 RepID=A0AAJ0CHI6_9HYPO|nr:hypothetical protein QQS21_011517 [Conoideocrella luteorostrata]
MRNILWIFLTVANLALASFFFNDEELANLPQKAIIRVQNSLKEPVYGVTVLHRHMDSNENKTWDEISPSKLSDEMQVHTTTPSWNDDWWNVVFLRKNENNKKVICFSDPQNFRGLAEPAEYLARAFIVALGFVGGPVSGGYISATQFVSQDTSSNTIGSKNNLKKHNLNGDDLDRITIIEIRENKSVVFVSPSGRSETQFTCVKKSLKEMKEYLEDLNTHNWR